MIIINDVWLTNCLRSAAKHIHPIHNELIDRVDIPKRASPEGEEEGIHQGLDVIVYSRFHRRGRHSDAVNLDLTGIGSCLKTWNVLKYTILLCFIIYIDMKTSLKFRI